MKWLGLLSKLPYGKDNACKKKKMNLFERKVFLHSQGFLYKISFNKEPWI